MKKIIFLLIAVFYFQTSHSQFLGLYRSAGNRIVDPTGLNSKFYHYESEFAGKNKKKEFITLKTWGLKGKVKSFKEKGYDQDLIFDEKGYCIQKIYFDGMNKMTSKFENKYDDSNNLIEVKTKTELFKYKYDGNSNLIEEIEYYTDGRGGMHPDGSQKHKNTYEYLNNPSQIIMKSYNENGSNTDVNTFNYDKMGNLISYENWVFQYDAKGNVIEEECNIKFKNIQSLSRGRQYTFYKYKYDERGNITEYKNIDGYLISAKYNYDNHGNIVEINININQPNAKGLLHDIILFKYEYDNWGNWIKKSQFTNGTFNRIAERTIEYY